MCGFVGIVNFNQDISKETKTVSTMLNTLTKRGPDQDGILSYHNVILGHKRLIVVDPTGGLQPMCKKVSYNGESYVYWLVYNGELYNTEDLRKELLAKGYTFDSYSDTEVLLTSYMHWGASCVEHLNGIFAFAIYDEKEQQVLLVRDPLGVKPLFYSHQKGSFIFASEIKALLKHPDIQPTVNKEGLTELFALSPAVKPGSAIFKEIKEIPPAHLMLIKPREVLLKEYWKLKAEENHETLEEATEHLRFLLIDAINRQLVGDVPLCTFLSGGLDSSCISAISAKAYREQGKTLTTYSLQYEDDEKYFKQSVFEPTSDAYWANEMANFLNTNHHVYTIKQQELAEALKDAMIARDLAGMADIDASLFLFCKEMRKDFVVGLSGECADEIFGGYPWYTRPELRDLPTFPWSNFLRSRRALMSRGLKNLPIEEFANECYLDSLKRVPHIENESIHKYRTREIFYLNIKWFMVNLLNRKDRMSMANSLEVRVPFADYRLVEYAFNLKDEYLFYEGREKGLLRKCLKGILPEDIIYRKKSPFPKTHHPVYTKLVCTMLEEILKKPNHPVFELIDKSFASELVLTEGAAYKRPWYGQLMTGPQLIAFIVQLALWLETYKVNLTY